MKEISGTSFRNQWAELTEPVTVKRYTKIIGEWFPSGTRSGDASVEPIPEPIPEPTPEAPVRKTRPRKTATASVDLNDIPEAERGWFTKKMGIDKKK